VIYSLLNGLSYMLLYAFGSEVGGITSSVIGFILYGPMRPGSQWWWILIVGAIEGLICYFLFKWWIIKFINKNSDYFKKARKYGQITG